MIEKECVPGTDIPKPTVQLVGEDENAFANHGEGAKGAEEVQCSF